MKEPKYKIGTVFQLKNGEHIKIIDYENGHYVWATVGYHFNNKHKTPFQKFETCRERSDNDDE